MLLGIRTSILALLCFQQTVTAQAFEFTGTKQIRLIEEDGRSHIVGEVSFDTNNGSTNYSVSWNDDAFAEHFLSMRPFKCFEGDVKYWCRVPYPYDINRSVSHDDFTDLEYDLLFIWKGSSEYGINMWNGVYYKLEQDGERLVGKLHEMDMEKLGVPPDAGNLRPIRDGDLEEGDPSSHWLPELEIK